MKKLLGNSIVFTISNVLLQAITFLLLPLYSNIISTSEYGIISNINTIIMLCNYIVTLCIDCVITRYYFDCVNEEEVKQLFSKISYFSECRILLQEFRQIDIYCVCNGSDIESI